MDGWQFWKWDLWVWLGDLVASQPFLTLMVPATTLLGVVITTKSNERLRYRDLQQTSEQWRHEVVKESEADQRQAVLSFLQGVAELQRDMSDEFLEEEYFLSQSPAPFSGWYEEQLMELNWSHWNRFRRELEHRLLALEISLASGAVHDQVGRVREKLRDGESLFAPSGEVQGAPPNPYRDEFFSSSSPMTKDVESAIHELKQAAVNDLHSEPPAAAIEPPSRRKGLTNKRNRN